MSGVVKVVINDCYGGFGLSDEAKREYLRRAGKTWTEEPSRFAIMGPHFKVDGEEGWYDRDLKRDDPLLVALVEEMGREASGNYARLKVVEVPADADWYVDEYDGLEHVTEGRTWTA